MRQAFSDGIAWGQAKQQTFELINNELAQPRERYEALMAEPKQIEKELLTGAERARSEATPFLAKIREAIGFRSLT